MTLHSAAACHLAFKIGRWYLKDRESLGFLNTQIQHLLNVVFQIHLVTNQPLICMFDFCGDKGT